MGGVSSFIALLFFLGHWEISCCSGIRKETRGLFSCLSLSLSFFIAKMKSVSLFLPKITKCWQYTLRTSKQIKNNGRIHFYLAVSKVTLKVIVRNLLMLSNILWISRRHTWRFCTPIAAKIVSDFRHRSLRTHLTLCGTSALIPGSIRWRIKIARTNVNIQNGNSEAEKIFGRCHNFATKAL